MTDFVLDVAQWQGSLRIEDVQRAGFRGVNLKTSHGLGLKSVHPDVAGWVTRARARRMWISTFHFLTGEASGRAQAEHAFARLRALGLEHGTVHQCDCEADATLPILREYIVTMQRLLGRPIAVYSGNWWWAPRGWTVSDLTPYLWSSPRSGYLGSYPGDASPHWKGYGGWSDLAIMQYAVAPLVYPDGSRGTIDVSKSAVRDPAVWARLAGGGSTMATAPVCNPGDLERYAGPALPDPWAGARSIDGSLRYAASWPDIIVQVTEDPLTAPERDFRAMGRAGWIVVASLNALLVEFNDVAPERDKASDGSIGDTAHAGSVSDHNPDETGNTGSSSDADDINEVHARDFDKDLRRPGLTMEMCAQHMVMGCRAGRITWIKYIIFNKRIWTASSGTWVTQAYTGANPHTEHLHVSSKYDTASENDTRPVGLKALVAPPPEEDDDMATITQADFNARMDAWWLARMAPGAADNPQRSALRVAPWQQQVGRTGRTAHDVLFGDMQTNITAGATAAVANSRALAALDMVDETALAAALLPALLPQLTAAILDNIGDVTGVDPAELQARVTAGAETAVRKVLGGLDNEPPAARA